MPQARELRAREVTYDGEVLPGSRVNLGLTAAAISAAVALSMGPAVGHPFLPSHDDGQYVVWNPIVRAPAWEAIRGAFTTAPLGAWAPLHVLSHAADHALWGDWAGGYALVNLCLHALAAVLLAGLALRLGAPIAAAAAAGLFFAVHPAQVESVVWISQRKSTLAAVFILATLHAWISYARARPGRRLAAFALALAAAAAALLSKAVAVVLPVALAVLDVPLARARACLAWVTEKLPFLAMALATAWITVLAKTEVGSAMSVEGHTRAAAGGFAYHGGSALATFYTMATVLPRYLRLLVWPVGLSAVYVPPIHTGIDAEVAASLLLLVALAIVGFWFFRRRPRLFFWYALFFVGLMPASQIVPQATLMNDRYLNVPLMGAAALAGEGVAAALARAGPLLRRLLVGCAAAALLTLSLQARARTAVWSSDVRLWADAAAKAPRSPYAWYNLGRAQEAAGQDGAALEAYLRAHELDPLDADPAVNAGAIYLRRRDLNRARPLVEEGARLLGEGVEAQFNLGYLRLVEGRLSEAEAALRRAHELDPAACPPGELLGHVLTLAGRPRPALTAYREAAAHGCSGPELDRGRAFAEDAAARVKE